MRRTESGSDDSESGSDEPGSGSDEPEKGSGDSESGSDVPETGSGGPGSGSGESESASGVPEGSSDQADNGCDVTGSANADGSGNATGAAAGRYVRVGPGKSAAESYFDETQIHGYLPMNDNYTEKADEHRKLVRIAAETEARLAADPRVQQWLQQFQGDGNGLLSDYAEEKARCLVYGPGWLEAEQERAAGAYQEAYERFWQIQQKKLFNLQCLWRAGQVEVPGVTDGREFVAWGKQIHRCPVLEPVTPDEVALYQRYLQSEDCQDLEPGLIGTTGWQYYREFRMWWHLEDRGSGSPGHDMIREGIPDDLAEPLGSLFNMFYHYPDWYAYYDLYQGTASLLRLPDVRGADAEHEDDEDEEDEAVDTAPAPEPAAPPVAKVMSEEEPESAPAPAAEPLAYLSPHDLELTETLIKRFESPELLRHMRAVEHREKIPALTRQADETYSYLAAIYEPLPIEAGPDWRQCLIDAYVNHQRRVVSAALDAVYDDYCLREQAGIAHPDPDA